jgi:hypothetical protein
MKKPVKKKERAPLKEDLKIRVLNAKKELPRSGITSLFFHYFKDTFNDSVKNKSKLNNVLQLRITDLIITEKLEELVELLKPDKLTECEGQECTNIKCPKHGLKSLNNQ